MKLLLASGNDDAPMRMMKMKKFEARQNDLEDSCENLPNRLPADGR